MQESNLLPQSKRIPPLAPAREAEIRAAFAAVPFGQLLGLELEALEAGVAVVGLAVTEHIKQNLGVVHGGATAALIDTASAFAAMTVLQAAETTTTIDLSIQYLRPATQGRLRARAQVRRAGRRILALAIDVHDDNGVLLATALTTYLRL